MAPDDRVKDSTAVEPSKIDAIYFIQKDFERKKRVLVPGSLVLVF